MLGLLIRLLNSLLANIVAPGGRGHVIEGVIAVVVRLCIEYLLPFLVVFVEKGPLDLHWSISEFNLSSRRSSMVVSLVLLRSIMLRRVVVLVLMLRETVDGCRRRELLLETPEAIIVASKVVLDL